MVLSWPGAFQHVNKRDLRKQQHSVTERKGERSRDARGIVYDQMKQRTIHKIHQHLISKVYMLDSDAAPPAYKFPPDSGSRSRSVQTASS